jgi:hypothetical protein
MGGKQGPAGELSRRDFIERSSLLGLGAIVLAALPVAERMYAADPAVAAVPFDDATLQAFADTIIPGRKASRTDLGHEIHSQAIAGVDNTPGAVEADTLLLMKDPRVGFDALAPALLADLEARSLEHGGDFLSLPFDDRVEVVKSGLDFGNGSRKLWEAGAAVPFTAFCGAAVHEMGTSRNASGYRVMGHPGPAPNGYRAFTYRRRLARERTRTGYLP